MTFHVGRPGQFVASLGYLSEWHKVQMVVEITLIALVVKALSCLPTRNEGPARNEPCPERIELIPVLDGDGEIHVVCRTPGGKSEYMGEQDIACRRAYKHIIDLFGLRFFCHGAKDVDRDIIDGPVSPD